jgi:hypothetical protein
MKTLCRMLLTFAAMVFIANLTFSQNTAKTQDVQKATMTVSNTQGKFVDANKNGVCDNFEARGKTVKGANFVDKNGDGVCDNRSNSGKGLGKGKRNCCCQGLQHRHGQGNGNCCGQGRHYGNGPGCGNKSN